MDDSFRKYTVVETNGMNADELQKILDDATDGFPEKQIDHVIGTKLILGHESLLNAKGRAEAAVKKSINSRMNNSRSSSI